MAAAAEPDEFWFNSETKQVEEGRQSSWQHLLGPYPTRAAAEHALEQAAERTRRWDADEREKG